MNIESLFTSLHALGRVSSAEVPAMTLTRDNSPWYTRALMGGMGWLGGLLVLGFVGAIVSGLFDSAAALLVMAVALFVGSAAIYRHSPHNDFATQFALAASICGQVMMAVAIGKMVGYRSNDATVACLVALMQVVLVWFMPNYLHRFLSTLFAVAAMF
ncbi:MAG: DUF4401 domain-containing protein, partial [Betaproteobacteria bacterium]